MSCPCQIKLIFPSTRTITHIIRPATGSVLLITILEGNQLGHILISFQLIIQIALTKYLRIVGGQEIIELNIINPMFISGIYFIIQDMIWTRGKRTDKGKWDLKY